MKKLIIIAVMLIMSMVAVPVFAHNEDVSSKPYDDLVLGAKFDAPNIIRITDNLTVGIEGSKDLIYTNAKEGWTAFGKLTYTGCLLFCK